MAEISDPDRAFAIAADDFARVNPNTGTAPIFRSRRDMALTTAIYARLPVLVNRSGGETVATWPARYVRMFDMTNDSNLFRTRAELEEREGAWPIGDNRFGSATGEWVPLYEGKMVRAFDHRAASVVVNPDNTNRPAQPLPATEKQHADPSWLPDPQFWVQPPEGLARRPYVLAFKDVTSPTNVRSMIAAILPIGAAGNTLPLIEVDSLWQATRDLSGKAFEKALLDFARKGSRQVDKHGRPLFKGIRRVRVREGLTLIPISGRAGQPYKGYLGDSNARYNVWQMPDGRWVHQVISTFDLHQRGFIEQRPHPAAKKVLSLRQNDLIAIERDGAPRQIMRVQKYGQNGQIFLIEHNEAGNMAERNKNTDDPFKFYGPGASALRNMKARQVRIDELGRIFDPGPR